MRSINPYLAMVMLLFLLVILAILLAFSLVFTDLNKSKKDCLDLGYEFNGAEVLNNCYKKIDGDYVRGSIEEINGKKVFVRT